LKEFINRTDGDDFAQYVNDLKKDTDYSVTVGGNYGNLRPSGAIDMISAFLHPENHKGLDDEEEDYVEKVGEIVITILGHSNGALPILGTQNQMGTVGYINAMSEYMRDVPMYQKVLLEAAEILAVKYPQIVIHDDTDNTDDTEPQTPRLRLELRARNELDGMQESIDEDWDEILENKEGYFEWFKDEFASTFPSGFPTW
jgi:hypothetical protein